MKDKVEPYSSVPDRSTTASARQPEVSLRAAAPADDDFLFALFASTRSRESEALADPRQAQALLKMQWTAQLHIYHGSHPGAVNSIIVLGEESIGRMLVERGAAEIQLIDIAIVPAHRNTGIGSALLQDLLSQAAMEGKPVRLQVFNFNPAQRLYERLGFSPVSDDGVYLEMRWTG